MIKPLGRIEAIRAKGPERVPTVLSWDEVRRLLAELDHHPTIGLLCRLLYGGGQSVSGGCELRVMDVDFDRRQLVIRCGNGWKDRAVPLPVSCLEALTRHLDRVQWQHDRALAKEVE